MRTTAVLTFVALVAVCPPYVAVQAEGLTLERYVTVSIERLELTEYTWRQEKRGPSEAEERALLSNAGTTQKEYMAFSGTNRAALDAYLAAQPEQAAHISELQSKIRNLIQQAE